jgi:hypothetical protein
MCQLCDAISHADETYYSSDGDGSDYVTNLLSKDEAIHILHGTIIMDGSMTELLNLGILLGIYASYIGLPLFKRRSEKFDADTHKDTDTGY